MGKRVPYGGKREREEAAKEEREGKIQRKK